MKHALIVGIGSDIAQEITRRLIRDGWRITGTYRQTKPDFSTAGEMPNCENVNLIHSWQLSESIVPWDLLLFATGTLEPIGPFFETEAGWNDNIMVNALVPLGIARECYPHHKPGSSIVFLAGTNPNKPALRLSAYHLSKIMLMAAAEQLNAEGECKVFSLGPGFVKTKMTKGMGQGLVESSHDDIYKMLETCMAYPKAVIGGKNIHIRDEWKSLAADDRYKLRRG